MGDKVSAKEAIKAGIPVVQAGGELSEDPDEIIKTAKKLDTL